MKSQKRQRKRDFDTRRSGERVSAQSGFAPAKARAGAWVSFSSWMGVFCFDSLHWWLCSAMFVPKPTLPNEQSGGLEGLQKPSLSYSMFQPQAVIRAVQSAR